MSTASAAAFLEALDRNEGLRREWQSAMGAAVQDAMLRFAARHGHTLTQEDLSAALEEREHALSDADLERVAGGLNPQPEPPAINTLLVNPLLRYVNFGPIVKP